ncbi:MAG: tyrosine-type recombinase/integrase [Candidatus Binataceae bacterium]
MLGDAPERIPLELPALSAKLAKLSPAAAGVSPKTLHNLRSHFLAAVKASGLHSAHRSARLPLSPAWQALLQELSTRRAHLGLSRFARYAGERGIEPSGVDDSTIEALIATVRAETLHRKPNDLHRKVAQIWNEAAECSSSTLQSVQVPSFKHPPQRVDWSTLSDSFRADVDRYLKWSVGTDMFATDARPRAMAPRTVQLRRDQIHAAVTALIETGVPPAGVASLADLVAPENFKRILRHRYEMSAGKENVFNKDLARSLIEIAYQWAKVDEATGAELRRLVDKLPTPAPGLTRKNTDALRQFDDPQALHRLVRFPHRVWAEVKKSPRHDRYTLAKAQVALAVGILCYMPIRSQNLAALAFDAHLFLKDAPGAVSSLELPASEVKNKIPIAFDIPPRLAKMLIEYRNDIAPKIIGRRPDSQFVNADGARKHQATVSHLISRYLKKHEGILLSPHQFRHVNAMVMLNHSPGNFEGVRQLLGHSSVQTTAAFYAGIDSRRAARHHQALIDAILNAPPSGRKR